MRIRAAEDADVPSLVRLFIEFHEFHVRGVPDRLRVPERYDEEELSSIVRSTINGESSSILVLEDRGHIRGLAEIYVKDDEAGSLVAGRRYGYLQSLLVADDHRRRGWGSALLHEAEEWARQQGAEEVRLDIWEFGEGPLGFYEESGYRTLRREMVRDL